MLQIALAMTFADFHIALVLGVVAFFDACVDFLREFSAVGQSQLNGGDRLDRAVDGNGHLGIEKDDKDRTVGIVGIVIPPFVFALFAPNAGAVLPEFDHVALHPHFFIMGIIVGVDGIQNFAHYAVPPSVSMLLQDTAV